MHLHGLCGSWMEHPFWRSKFTLTDTEDIRRICDSGITEVWIDVAKGLDKPTAKEEPGPSVTAVKHTEIAPGIDALKPASKSEELQRAAMICVFAKKAVVSMFWVVCL